MPLSQSPSDDARSANIAEMIRAGHPRAQAVAAAYSNQRKMRRRHKRRSKRHHKR